MGESRSGGLVSLQFILICLKRSGAIHAAGYTEGKPDAELEGKTRE